MSTIKPEVLEYMSGLTGFVFDKAVLVRIALDRGVTKETEVDFLSEKDKDLILADLLLTAYLSPNVWASFKHTHGSFSKGYGQQSIFSENKQKLYDFALGIYRKYDDKKLELLEDSSVTMKFLDL